MWITCDRGIFCLGPRTRRGTLVCGMSADSRTIDRQLLVRRCVACGYDGALLRGGTAPRCAHCGCDLRQRPARSYAEMEGLLGQDLPVRQLTQSPAHHYDGVLDDRRFVQRCFGFLLLLLTAMALLYFATAAFDV